MAAKEAETKEWKNQHGEVETLTAYDVSQRMRRMENTMRRTRSRAAAFKAAESMDDYKAQKARYHKQRKEYKEFCETMGFKTEFERVYLDGIGKL